MLRDRRVVARARIGRDSVDGVAGGGVPGLVAARGGRAGNRGAAGERSADDGAGRHWMAGIHLRQRRFSSTDLLNFSLTLSLTSFW